MQAKATKSAKRRLRQRARREARHAACVNHKIAKMVVADAQRTGRGIALEDLQGIRDRVRLRRHQRATLSNWPFHRLGEEAGAVEAFAGAPGTPHDGVDGGQGHERRAVAGAVREDDRCVGVLLGLRVVA